FTYRYDLRGRLVEAKRDGVVVEAYAHDANGNRVRGTYDDQDRLLAYGTKTYSYTANGELASTSDGTQYTYDAHGALLSVELPDGRLIEYVIDGMGRRVGKKVDGVLQWGLLYRSALQPVAVLDGAGNVVDRYVYGSSRNVPEYVERSGERYRILTDHLGSLRLVVNVGTGEVVQRMEYDSFGVVLVDEVAAGWEPVLFGFAGGVYDRDTGFVRFGARDYDASVGRWTGKDPIRFEAEGTNLFEYALGDPVNYVDVDGLDPSAATSTWLRDFALLAAGGAALGPIGAAVGGAAIGAGVILACGSLIVSDTAPKEVAPPRKKKKKKGCLCLCNNAQQTKFNASSYEKCQEYCTPN
ncbi:MAG: RHS repeat-associated core domain-containing protein, partial [Coriobacteriia bacterium]|nr:RHS repeat-associated core domain-containing protein [Coriobacteriia bacterium]